VSPELGPEPRSGSGPYPIIDRETPVHTRVGVIGALVGFAFALGGGFVRYEGKAEWARERIVKLEAKEETRAADKTSDALRLQRIEDALRRIEDRLNRREGGTRDARGDGR
jgi:hypothetical protein